MADIDDLFKAAGITPVYLNEEKQQQSDPPGGLRRGYDWVMDDSAFGRGFRTMQQGANMLEGEALGYTPERLNRIAELGQKIAANERPEPVQRMGTQTFSEGLDTFLENPATVLGSVVPESLGAFVPALGMAYLPARGAAAGLTGLGALASKGGLLSRGLGAAATGAGKALGWRGALPSATAIASGGISYPTEFLGNLTEAGVDTTDPASLRAGLANPEIADKARGEAALYAAPVAALDAASMGLAGRLVGAARTPFTRLGALTGELGTQMALGAGGDALGQLAAYGRIKNESGPLLEAIGELGPGAVETVLGATQVPRAAAPRPLPQINPNNIDASIASAFDQEIAYYRGAGREPLANYLDGVRGTQIDQGTAMAQLMGMRSIEQIVPKGADPMVYFRDGMTDRSGNKVEGSYDPIGHIMELALNRSAIDAAPHESGHVVQRLMQMASDADPRLKRIKALWDRDFTVPVNQAQPEYTIDQLPASIKRLLKGLDATEETQGAVRNYFDVLKAERPGAFTGQEWQAITVAAYDRARSFGGAKRAGIFKPLVDSVVDTFDRVRNMASGFGFQTSADVTEGIATGNFNRRIDKALTKAGAILNGSGQAVLPAAGVPPTPQTRAAGAASPAATSSGQYELPLPQPTRLPTPRQIDLPLPEPVRPSTGRQMDLDLGTPVQRPRGPGAEQQTLPLETRGRQVFPPAPVPTVRSVPQPVLQPAPQAVPAVQEPPPQKKPRRTAERRAPPADQPPPQPKPVEPKVEKQPEPPAESPRVGEIIYRLNEIDDADFGGLSPDDLVALRDERNALAKEFRALTGESPPAAPPEMTKAAAKARAKPKAEPKVEEQPKPVEKPKAAKPAGEGDRAFLEAEIERAKKWVKDSESAEERAYNQSLLDTYQAQLAALPAEAAPVGEAEIRTKHETIPVTVEKYETDKEGNTKAVAKTKEGKTLRPIVKRADGKEAPAKVVAKEKPKAAPKEKAKVEKKEPPPGRVVSKEEMAERLKARAKPDLNATPVKAETAKIVEPPPIPERGRQPVESEDPDITGRDVVVYNKKNVAIGKDKVTEFDAEKGAVKILAPGGQTVEVSLKNFRVSPVPKKEDKQYSSARNLHDGDLWFDGKTVEAAHEAGRVRYMSPEDFISVTRPGVDRAKEGRVRKLVESQTQFSSLPALVVGEDGRVESHDGRQRAMALSGMGIQSMPTDVTFKGPEPETLKGEKGPSAKTEIMTPKVDRPTDATGSQYPSAREEIAARLSANPSPNIGTIPGLAELAQQAKADTDQGRWAGRLLNDVAADALRHLLGGVQSAKVEYLNAQGLYGGDVEPSLGVGVGFDPADRAPVLAALARFAANFNQEQIHILGEPENETIGHDYGDGSYNTPHYVFQLAKPLSRAEIENVIAQSGLYGMTAFENSLEAYYVGDPKDVAEIEKFERGIDAARQSLGADGQAIEGKVARLWPYGYGAIPYERIAGEVRPGPSEIQNRTAQRIASRLARREVVPFKQADEITPDQRVLQQRVMRNYEALPLNDLANPDVRRAYTEAAAEIIDQYEALPIKVEVWDGKGEPYSEDGKVSSAAMRRDVLDNNHLFIYGTDVGTFGPEGVTYDNHPLLKPSRFRDVNGRPLVVNDLLRAVHDYYAHTLSPVTFGPKGEETAWRNHMAMTSSPWARWAITSETRGQNSWVNFREQVQDKPLSERGFGDQKVGLLDLDFVRTGEPAVDAPVDTLAEEIGPQRAKGSVAAPNTSNEPIQFSHARRMQPAWQSNFDSWSQNTPIFAEPAKKGDKLDEGINDVASYRGGPVTLQAYSGSTFDFDAVDPEFSKINRAAYMGGGFYVTTTRYDASTNYAGLGPDRGVTIEAGIDEIIDGINEDPYDYFGQIFEKADKGFIGGIVAKAKADLGIDLNVDDATNNEASDLIEIAENDPSISRWLATEFYTGETEGVVYPVFVRFTNPFFVGGRSTAKFTDMEKDKLADAIKTVAQDWPIEGRRVNQLLYILEEAENPYQFWHGINHGYSGLVTPDGESASYGEFINDALREAGYDGIIMHVADTHIRQMMDVHKNTLHAVPFTATQVKSQYNTGEFGETENLSYSRARGTPAQEALIARTLNVNPIPFKQAAKNAGQRFVDGFLTGFRRNFVYKYADIEKLERAMNGGNLFFGPRSAIKLLDSAEQIPGRLDTLVNWGAIVLDPTQGTFKLHDPVNKKGLIDILRPIEERGLGPLFHTYRLLNRAERIQRQEDAKAAQENRAPRQMTPYTATDFPEAANLLQQYPMFAQVDADLQFINNTMIDNAVKAGVFSTEQGDALKFYGDYVPFYRQEENGEVIGPSFYSKVLSANPQIHKLTGSNKHIFDDHYSSIMSNWTALMSASLNNLALTQARNLMLQAGVANRLVEVPNGWVEIAPNGVRTQHKRKPNNAVNFRSNGQEASFTVLDPNLFNALSNMGAQDMGAIYNLMLTFSDALRTGVTHTPPFMMANLIRGMGENFVKGIAPGFVPGVDTAKGLVKSLKNDASKYAVMAAGGGGGYFYGSRVGIFQGEKATQRVSSIMKRRLATRTTMSPARLGDALHALWRGIETVGEATEMADRIAAYEKAPGGLLDKGHRALDVINFSRRGRLMKYVPLIPFLNARIQGLDRLFRGYKENPMGFLLRGSLLTAATVALYAMNKDDERWRRLEASERMMYYHLWVGDMHIRIPKMFEVSTLFSTLPELLLEGVGQEAGFQKKDPRYNKLLQDTVVQSVLNTFSANPLPQGILPTIEAITNWDFFLGRNIVPDRLSRVRPEDQATSQTTDLAKAFGRLTGTSPIMTEHLINGYLGTLGTYALNSANALYRAATDAPERPASGIWGDHPAVSMLGKEMLGRFVREEPGRSNRFISDFYEIKTEIDQIYNSVNAAKSMGDIERFRELTQDPENRKLLGMRRGVDAIADQLATINKMEKRIYENDKLSAQQKHEQLVVLTNRRHAVAARLDRIFERI